MYNGSMTLSQDLTSRALFHSENNVILVTLREREILIATWSLFVVSMTPRRFHSSHISRSEVCLRLQQL